MLKTKDGYELKVGMWIHSTAGVFEVIELHNDSTPAHAYIAEVIWNDEENPDKYVLEKCPAMVVKADMSNYFYE